MLNIYRIIKDYIPLGTKLYIKNLDKYVIFRALNDENKPDAIECVHENVIYYFDKNNICTNHIDNNYKLVPSKNSLDWYYIITYKIGEPVMFNNKYHTGWQLGNYYSHDNVIIDDIHSTELNNIIPVKYFDFANFK